MTIQYYHRKQHTYDNTNSWIFISRQCRLSRILGILLAALAVQFILNGITMYIGGLGK